MPESRPPATAEQPYAVHEISALLSDYLARLGETWVEGQVAEIRETASLAYLKLRDIERDVTLSLYLPSTRSEEHTSELQSH